MRNHLIFKALLSLFFIIPISVAFAQQSFVAGPIDRFDSAKNELSVMGQRATVGPCTSIFVSGKKLAALPALNSLDKGRFVYLEMHPFQKGATIVSIAVLPEPYVAGASTIFVGGNVREVDASNGFITIGTLKIDVSTLSPEVLDRISYNTFLEISGIQPVAGGTVVAAKALSVGGSGLTRNTKSQIEIIDACTANATARSIDAVGALSVGGSGAPIVGGPGALSVGGSGAPIVGGPGTLSVGGSGAPIVGGTGASGVGGSGTLGVGGSGTLGVGGSGTLGVGGSGTSSVGGSGR